MMTTGESARKASGNSKAGLGILLGAAIVLAGAIGYRSFNAGDNVPTASSEVSDFSSIEELRESAEAAGEDAQPWQQLGFAHFQRGEFALAAQAYERAVEIDQEEAVLWSALGEARVMASQRDPMPPGALEAFNRASQIDPSDPRARYFLNVQKDLDGDHEGAITGWLALLAETPQGAPWEADLVRTIEQVGAINRIDVASRLDVVLAARSPAPTGGGLGGPTASQIAAAGSIPPSEQRAMAVEMVSRLEQRLAAEPDNLEGWVMLMRSRMTLEQPQHARAALEAAVRAIPREESRLRSEARALGIG